MLASDDLLTWTPIATGVRGTLAWQAFDSADAGGHRYLRLTNGAILGVAELRLFGQVVPAGPGIDVTVASRCVADRVVLEVVTSNLSGGPVSAAVSTPFGEKRIPHLEASHSSKKSFKSRANEVASGTITVTAAARDGASSTEEAAFEAIACG